MQDTQRKAYGYIRVSTSGQELSPLAQIASIRAYCQGNGLELVEVYQDIGVSGAVPLEDREQGKKLLEAALSSNSTIVSYSLSRLFRDIADGSNWIRQFDKVGVSLCLVNVSGNSIDTGSATGRMFINLLLAVDMMEREIVGERTKEALAVKKASGRVYGPIPLGWDKGADGELVANPSEQVVIRRMKAMKSEGVSFNRIANTLNGEGLRGKKGGKFQAVSIQKILGNSILNFSDLGGI